MSHNSVMISTYYPHSTIMESNLESRRFLDMKATGIVRRIDDLGRVVIPKEIRRTMRIREGDPTLTSLTPVTRFLYAIMDISKRFGVDHEA